MPRILRDPVEIAVSARNHARLEKMEALREARQESYKRGFWQGFLLASVILVSLFIIASVAQIY